jgi:hypothetical protein
MAFLLSMTLSLKEVNKAFPICTLLNPSSKTALSINIEGKLQLIANELGLQLSFGKKMR